MVVIPIYNLLIVPDANIYLKEDQYRHLARRYAEVNDRVVLLSCKKEEHRKDMTEESFYPIGVTGFVNEVNPEGYVVIRTVGRVDLDMIGINPDHTIELTVSRRPDNEDLDENVAKRHFEKLKENLKENWQGFEWGEQAMSYLEQFHSISEIAVAMSIWFKMSAEEKFGILAEDSRKKRLELLEKAVYEFMEVSKVTTQAAGASAARTRRDAPREGVGHPQVRAQDRRGGHERDCEGRGAQGAQPSQTGEQRRNGSGNALRLSGFCHRSVLEEGTDAEH